MCGRFTQKTSPDELARAFELAQLPPDLGLRYNIAPSLSVLAVPHQAPRHAEVFRWGLVPAWADDPAIGQRLANARSETAAEKPAFRDALRKRRCLVLADGFYEWKTAGNHKLPFYFTLRDGAPFAMAGLWEVWRPTPDRAGPNAGDALHTTCLLTTDANAVVGEVHDRMPVILPPSAWSTWLDPELHDPARLQPLLRPLTELDLVANRVSRYVNSAAHEGPACIAPDTGPQGWLL